MWRRGLRAGLERESTRSGSRDVIAGSRVAALAGNTNADGKWGELRDRGTFGREQRFGKGRVHGIADDAGSVLEWDEASSACAASSDLLIATRAVGDGGWTTPGEGLCACFSQSRQRAVSGLAGRWRWGPDEVRAGTTREVVAGGHGRGERRMVTPGDDAGCHVEEAVVAQVRSARLLR